LLDGYNSAGVGCSNPATGDSNTGIRNIVARSQLSSILGTLGAGADISEEKQRFQRIVRGMIGNMIVGNAHNAPNAYIRIISRRFQLPIHRRMLLLTSTNSADEEDTKS